MVAVTAKNLLNIGLYTPSEAALYARVRPELMARWVHGNRAGRPVLTAQLPDDPDRTVTFLDFVQSLAIRSMRRDSNVPLQKIREAVEHAAKKYGLSFPLARKDHRIFVLDKEILVEFPPDDLVQIIGRDRDQGVFREVAELYMKQLTFDDQGLAKAYRAFTYQNREIIMDPTRRFGQPLITGCNYTALTLYEAYKAEGSIDAAARAYDVDQADVELAIEYFDYLGDAAA